MHILLIHMNTSDMETILPHAMYFYLMPFPIADDHEIFNSQAVHAGFVTIILASI